MPDTLESTLTIVDYWKYQTIDTGRAGPKGEELRERSETIYTKGSADNQLQELFRDRRTVTTSTTADDIDVAGVLSNIFGDMITFVKLRQISIYNLATASGEFLSVGGASSNPITSIFSQSGAPATASINVHPGGVLILSAPKDGFTVTAGSADTLRVNHEGSAGDISYDIILKGTL